MGNRKGKSLTVKDVQAEIDASEQVVMAIGDLIPREANPRKNTEAAKVLAQTVMAAGWGAAPLVQKSSGMIIAGHTRLKAALQLGLERLPVRVVDVDDKRAKALALADNRVGELAGWDFPGLAEDLGGFSLDEVEALGFDSKFLEDMADKVEAFGPLEADANPKLDRIEPDVVTCPHCGEQFDRRATPGAV